MAKLVAKRLVSCGLVLLMLLGLASGWANNEAQPAAADPVLEKRMLKIAAELRCLVCQNQTIADSSAGLAVDLRNQVREMLQRGQSEKEIMDYMTARYGEFVLYRPPVKTSTWLLWFGPMVLLVTGGGMLFTTLRRRSQMPPEAFELDEDETAQPTPSADSIQSPRT